MKKIAMLISMGLVAGALVIPAAPARAAFAAFAGAGTCEAHFSLWPTPWGTGADCGSSSKGVPNVVLGASNSGPMTCAPCSFTASIDHYSEPTACGPVLPPLGTADGTLYADGQPQGTYNWLRVGLTVVLVPVAPGTSAGVAAFVPEPPLPTCVAPGPLNAEIVGVAARV